jgi:hypothetical protein
MSDKTSNREYFFDSYFDIASLLGRKENVTDFLDFLLNESLIISQKMKDNGSSKPYPLIYNQSAHSVSMDYQYYIYILAKWVAKKTKNNADFTKVCNAFAILQSNSSGSNRTKFNTDRKKFLSILMTEFVGILTNRNKFADGTISEKKMYVGTYPSWAITVIETEEDVYVFNQVTIDKSQAEYYLVGYEKRVADMGDFVMQDDVEQSAFGTKNTSSYLKKNGLERRYYFTITNANLYNNEDIIYLNFEV